MLVEITKKCRICSKSTLFYEMMLNLSQDENFQKIKICSTLFDMRFVNKLIDTIKGPVQTPPSHCKLKIVFQVLHLYFKQ